MPLISAFSIFLCEFNNFFGVVRFFFVHLTVSSDEWHNFFLNYNIKVLYSMFFVPYFLSD